jgi:hypothetical protein
MTFTFRYKFQNKGYISKIEAQSQYAAQIKFNEFILSKIVIESIEEETFSEQAALDFLKGVFGMKTVLLFCLLALVSCRRDLAKECAKNYPCTPTKEVIDSIVYHTDTIHVWETLSSIPMMKVRCYEYTKKDSFEIYSIPCNNIIEQKEIWRTQWYEDSAKISIFMKENTQLRKDSLRIAQKLVDSENRYDKHYYFFRNGFIWSWIIIILLSALFIWRATKKPIL